MKIDEYQGKAMRTSPDGQDRIKNGCLGLIGESGELVDVVKKYMFQSGENPELPIDALESEIGDILWYCAQVFTGLGLKMSCYGSDFDDITAIIPQQIGFSVCSPDFEELFDLEWHCVDVSRSAQRAYHLAFVAEDKYTLAAYVHMMIFTLALICAKIGTSIQTVAERNIEKLARRYPEGFDPARSMNRE